MIQYIVYYKNRGGWFMLLNDLLFRYYTKELENSTKTVYDLFDWKTVDVKITDHKSGKVIVDMENLEFPVHYSQSACDIIASKYFRKGVPNDRDMNIP